MGETPLTFSYTDESLPAWLHDKYEEARVSAYGEPLAAILMVTTADQLLAFTYGFDGITQKLRMIDEARKLIKYGR